MVALLFLLLNLLASPFKSTSRLEAENAVLRQQVVVLQRNLRDRLELTNGDRMFFVLLYRCFPSIQAMMIVRPETVGCALAPRRLPSLLALEVAGAGRAAADQGGVARADPADEC